MDASNDITLLVQRLRAEDSTVRNAAAEKIWRTYFPRLLKLAEAKIDKGIRARADGQDVLQSMYKSFCLRRGRGDFSLANRDELWHLLVMLTQRKIANLAKHHRRGRRDYRKDREITPGEGHADTPHEWTAEAAGPAPDEIAILTEELELRLQALSGELRRIAQWKLEGYTNEEIAGPDMLDCAVRTVERKLARIRKAWEKTEQATDG